MTSRHRPFQPIQSFSSFALILSLAGWAGPVLADQRDDLSEKDKKRVEAILKIADAFDKPEPFETMTGGRATTSAVPDAKAYSHPNKPMTLEERQDFQLGFSIFKKLWVSSPASTKASDGLGPLYNARSCLRCHPRNGRGHAPEVGEADTRTFLMRLSVPPSTQEEQQRLASKEVKSLPEPTYGGQLQDRALPGLPSEAKINVTYEHSQIELADGTKVAMRKPSFSLSDFGYGEPRADMMTSPRIATAMIGLGLIDGIHDSDFERIADPDDKDGDGISGRINYVMDKRAGRLRPGRFGWKASEPNVYQQSSHAAVGDIGLSVPILPSHGGDCTDKQTICHQFPHGGQENLGGLEIPQVPMDLMVYYSANIAVPQRRKTDDVDVLEGKKLFYEAGCASCHRPKFVTSREAEFEQHRFQLIWPYSDFLLHDMGPDLADGRPVGDASGSEWRTAPLWGIGLAQTVDPEAGFLHDGRARSLLEAVLWHGGEAEASRNTVVQMDLAQRKALLAFLKSL